MQWLRRLTKSAEKGSHLKPKYYRSVGEISSDKQLEEMFAKLDTDGSNAISIPEIKELFLENGIEMTREEVAEMFSIVKRINDKLWLEKEAARQRFVPKRRKKQTMEDKLKL